MYFITLPFKISAETYRKSKRYNNSIICNVERGRCVKLITAPPSVILLSRQCEILNILQPYRRPCYRDWFFLISSITVLWASEPGAVMTPSHHESMEFFCRICKGFPCNEKVTLSLERTWSSERVGDVDSILSQSAHKWQFVSLARRPRPTPRNIFWYFLYLYRLNGISLTSYGRSVGIVRLWTKGHGVSIQTEWGGWK
jgi:hypothetical protein